MLGPVETRGGKATTTPHRKGVRCTGRRVKLSCSCRRRRMWLSCAHNLYVIGSPVKGRKRREVLAPIPCPQLIIPTVLSVYLVLTISDEHLTSHLSRRSRGFPSPVQLQGEGLFSFGILPPSPMRDHSFPDPVSPTRPVVVRVPGSALRTVPL